MDATKTPLENLSEITRGFATFQGAAAKETETLSGQLKQQANEVDNLQEKIGEGLAPAWVALKRVIFEATLSLIGFNTQSKLRSDNFQKNAANRKEAIIAEVQGSVDFLVQAGVAKDKAEAQVLDRIRKRTQDEINKKIGIADFATDVAILKEQIKALDDYKNSVDALAISESNSLKAADLQGKSLEELNKLLKENELSNTLVAQSNVKTIERVIEQREKELEALKKVNDELAKKRLLEREGQRRLDNTAREDANTERQDQAIATAADDIAQQSADNRLGIETQFVDELNKLNEKSVEDRKKANEEITKDQAAQAKERTRISTIELLEQAALVGNFVSQVTQLFNTISEGRIQNINEDTEATLASIQLQEEAIDRSLEKNRISEEEAYRQKQALEKKKIDDQKKADAEIRRIRRQQAVLDKIAALFEITIATAVNVAKAENPFLKALALASGLAQGAIVAATPIPSYAKGTKDSGREGFAQVHKDEVMFLPAKSKVMPAKRVKQYSEAVDSMIDGTFDQFLYKATLNKEVNKVAKERETVKSREFADNLVASTTYQKEYLPSLHDRKNKPTKIENVNELAEAIADKLKGSHYR